VNTHRIRINPLALALRLPTMHAAREYVEGGRSDGVWTELPGPVPAAAPTMSTRFCAGRSRAISRRAVSDALQKNVNRR
jgi:hypothetical protein